ncbi:MAG: bifunctional 2-polyprenyl-6-hydroxyphenol methylase/3-demethylubiquinol 3-O-methyltransferase UbiG, partial [Henriciella sp.]|nr:bifunctional 2-polyprenyl-6-hydroxyphenol methylase/3-demethylubiquinol 3-O-methyltransferase UbiG [Henriciella sp.]
REAGAEPFDIVLNLEVVEHVADPAQFMKDTAALLRPGGLMIAATLNRTPKAFALAIVGAEYVLRWLPPGTHEFSKFLTPAEVAAPLQMAGLETDRPPGVSYNPVSDSWRLSNDTKVNYMLVARRPVSPGGG